MWILQTLRYVHTKKKQTYGLRPDLFEKEDDFVQEHLTEVGHGDWKSVALSEENEFLLSDFSTGSYFKEVCADADKYPLVDGKRPIPICLAIFSDKSLATSNSSEQPVVFSTKTVPYHRTLIGAARIHVQNDPRVRELHFWVRAKPNDSKQGRN